MLAGVAAYFLYVSIPALDATHQIANHMLAIVQPSLIFLMLFLTFCKVRPRDLRLSPWQGWMLLLQIASFVLGALWLHTLPLQNWHVVLEGAMLCMICPTATAAAVVTRKLGGNTGSLMAYTILINLAVALVVPACIPLMRPHPEYSFVRSFLSIIGRVFPLLLGPFFLAMLTRRYASRLAERLAECRDLPFYLWAISLSLAIAVTTKSIVHTHLPWIYQMGIALASLLACFLQFGIGRWLGCKYDDAISAAQAFGQKNTVFAIWMGYTFMNPVTSLAGGFYSIWHNVWNSWQLWRKEQESYTPPYEKIPSTGDANI
ncbi:MAG: transporter [Bacteroidaceae bacterium]|nr:transporter [Bacteroidaceae bacterium]